MGGRLCSSCYNGPTLNIYIVVGSHTSFSGRETLTIPNSLLTNLIFDGKILFLESAAVVCRSRKDLARKDRQEGRTELLYPANSAGRWRQRWLCIPIAVQRDAGPRIRYQEVSLCRGNGIYFELARLRHSRPGWRVDTRLVSPSNRRGVINAERVCVCVYSRSYLMRVLPNLGLR